MLFPKFSGMVTGTRMKYKRRTCEIKQLVWPSLDEIPQSEKNNVSAKLVLPLQL